MLYTTEMFYDASSPYGWEVCDDLTGDNDALVRGLLACAKEAEVPRMDSVVDPLTLHMRRRTFSGQEET
ncbi:unnamed protein product [Haemonchus placei]|uniref:DUF1902 domain-containing protein n=1 Tax=Haemonchus placei TaxID=6290 RepID=A0A0N4W2D3_HAEPC|nr:unnamed protein product [Haemonchus placei]